MNKVKKVLVEATSHDLDDHNNTHVDCSDRLAAARAYVIISITVHLS